MKRAIHVKVWFVLMVLLNVLIAQQSKASHAMGADLTYQCLGGNTYKISLSFYRDCIGIPAPTNPFVNINSASCGQSLGVTCYPKAGTGQEISPACSSSVTTCNGGSFTGIQEWVYEGIVTLPMQCTDWIFSYNLCCRNAAITTITTPGTSTFYIYATLNNTISPHNNSPTFSNKPVPFLCVGQQYCFNHGAYDADGDSLAYSLITPKQTAGTTVHYISPYSATNPLNSSPATTFNTFTGDICLTPQALQVTVMAVLVSEYRNGVLIGSVERDMQLTVMNCNNNLPTLTGINGTNNFSMTVCAGQPFCFNIFSNDIDTGQNLTVTWDNGIPNGTFTSTSAQHPTSTFCWTPTTSDISGTPHVFTVRVADNACPYIGSQIYSYSITVIGVIANAGPDQQIACSDLATITATGSGGSGTYTYLWSNGSTMQSITVGGGTYTVRVSDGTCSSSDTVLVTMPFTPVAAFTSSTANCISYAIHFTDQSSTPGGVLNYWHWDLGDGTTSTIQNPVHQYGTAGTYHVILIVGNTLGCFDTLNQVVTINPPPVVSFTASDACAGQTVSFIDHSAFGEHLNFWSWNFGDTTFSALQNPNHTYSHAGTFTVRLIAGDSLGCVDTAYRVVTIFPLPAVNAGSDQTICAGNSVTLTASGGSSYIWMPTGDTSSTITVNPGSTTNYNLTVADAHGCVASDMVTVIVNPLPAASAGPNKIICIGGSVSLTATGGSTYSWNPGGSTTSTINVSPTSNTTYTVLVTDANGCSASASASVNVNSLPVASISSPADICAGSGTTLTAGGGVSYSWNPTGSTSSTINVNPVSNTTYVVTVTDANGCSSTASVPVNVHTAPVVNLQSFFLCSGSNATLDAGNPGSTYSWSPGGQTTQVITITTGGNYSVVVTNAYGCSTNSSVNIATGASLTVSLGNISFCQGDSAVLNAGHPGMNYLWTPNGATTQTITVHSSGTYGVTVTDTAGCSGSISATAIVNPLPVANFTATNICAGNSTAFTDVSSVTTGSLATWSWTFGDGSSSAQQNPSHTYATAGTYTVQLNVTSSTGCSSSITNTVTVNPLPVADFNFTNACQNNAITLSNNSTVSSGNITGFLWNFGDGSTSTSQNTSHLYSSSGNYNVSLQVTTAGGCTANITRTVKAYPIPVAVFSTNPVCLGNPTAFSNNSTISSGSISDYDWDFGDSYTSTSHHPNHTYANAGVYTVTLTLNSNHGCTSSISYPVTVNALPVANAGTNQSICLGSGTTLTASGGTSFSWSPGGLTSSTINVNPASTTNYSVTVTDTNGCQATSGVSVNVNPLPVANAGPDKSICRGVSTTLNASGGLNYSWNPTGSTNSSISVSPVSTAIYSVTVTDANGCQSQDSVRVTVNSLPLINAGPDQTICNGSTISISATGGISYSWNPGGSTSSSILVTPTTNSNYVVVGTDANGCQSIDTVRVIVNSVPIVSIPTTLVCTGFSTVLDAGNAGSTFLWSTGESAQTISVTDSGTYQVLVTNTSGCSTLGSAYVTLAGSFTANPTNTSICSGQSVTLNAGNPGCNYLWNTGATAQSISVNTAGSYSVVVTDANGCSATIHSNVILNPNPVASFSAPPSCFGSGHSFTDLSTVSSGSIQSTDWNFGDGFSSVSGNPNHTYPSTGTFNVTLTVTTTNGCSASVTNPIVVNALPLADFNNTTVCLNQSTGFSDFSTVSGGSISGWNWTFGDGSSSTTQNPLHVYNSAGNYNASLVVTSLSGCKDTITKNINVKGLPVALFNAPSICANAVVQLNNNSYSMNGTISSYNWNFNNGSTSSAVNPNTTYLTDGNYVIQLVVTSSLGCSDTANNTITVFPLPASGFVTNPVCQNSSALFTNTSSVSNGSVDALYWNFGDGASSNQSNPSHVFASNGTYVVTLIATTNHFCRDTVTQSVIINPLPVSNFSAQDVCVNSIVNFTDGSTIASGNLASWSWDFGDNTLSSQNSPAHIYTNAGTYNVALTVTSNNGCSNTYFSNVNIFPDPVAQFAGANVCFTSATQFFNQTYVTGGSNFTSLWDFSDGTTSASDNPVHTYSNAGTYNVHLTVTSALGCSSQVNHTLSVYVAPVSSFSANNVCLGGQTQFLDSSSTVDGSVSSWYWNFGDNTNSNSNAPAHVYSQPGNYTVTLTTSSSFGCYSSTSGVVEIYPVPAPSILSNNACIGTAIDFADASGNMSTGIMNYAWSFGDGGLSNDSSATHIYANTGVYHVSLVTSNNYSCYSSDETDVSVFPKPSIGFQAANACYPASTQFTNASSINSGTIAGYHWNFGDGSTASVTNPLHAYTSTGTFAIVLVGTSNNGCVSADTELVKINPNPQVTFGPSLRGCSPLRASFSDSAWISQGSIAGWLWDFGDGGVSTQEHPVYTFDHSGMYSVSLTVVSNEGCQATVSQPNFVTIYPGPEASFTADPMVTDILNPLIHFDNLSQGYTSLTWNFGDGTSMANIVSPSHVFADTGSYSAQLITVNSYGCRDTAYRVIEVLPHSTLFAPNCFTPNGDGKNDVFKPSYTQMDKIQVWIFNRWGELLKSWDGLDGYWDGYYKGTACQEDVYVYKIKGHGLDGKEYEWVGHVSIVH